jgi:hypothetical protein
LQRTDVSSEPLAQWQQRERQRQAARRGQDHDIAELDASTAFVQAQQFLVPRLRRARDIAHLDITQDSGSRFAQLDARQVADRNCA